MNDPSTPPPKVEPNAIQGVSPQEAGTPPSPPQPWPREQAPLPQSPYGVIDPREPARPPPGPPPRRVPYRGIILGVVSAIAVVGVVVTMAFRQPPPRKARSIGARLDLAAGDVSVKDAAPDAHGSSAISGTPLGLGATVATGKGARALVRTEEGAAIFLRGDTQLTLADHGVDLGSGEIWLDAPKVEGDALETRVGKYSVSASDAGVSIKKDGGDIVVYVARGLAVLTSPGGRVEIGAGEQGKASADGKPAVSAVAFWNDWTGGMGDQKGSRFVGSGTGRLYGLDPGASAGAPARKLGIAKQVVHAVLRDGIAETEVDQTFSNPSATPIEGWYWFTVPQTATVTGFALETNGQLVEGEVIEKREAAAQYGNAVRSGNEPALLEWVDGRTYRARIYPIPASGQRRIVLRYLEMLPNVEGKTRYVYPLRSDDSVRFDEFALSVDVGATGDGDVDVASSLDARVENGGRSVTMRRSGYVPRADFQLELTSKKPRPPVAAWRFQAGADQADYVMLRYVPDRDFSKEPPVSADVVLVVDTSAGGDESARQLRKDAAEATLRALSEKDNFALVTLDVSPTVVFPKDSGLVPANEANIAKALEKLSEHTIDGATDLGAMFEPALARLHGKEQAAVVYVGDGAPTSGETGSEALLERLRRSLTGSRARLFAIGTGADAHHELLAQLARAGGGQYVRIDEPSQTTGQALRLTSALKTSAITDLGIDIGAGLDQPLYSASGKLSRGEELVLLARTHHPLPDKIKIHGRVGGKDFDQSYDVKVDTTSQTASLVPRLWAAEYSRRLMGANAEENRGQILQLGVEYGLITPFTSSLALDSEGAYARQGIPRRVSRVRGVKLTAVDLVTLPTTAAGCDRKLGSMASDDEPAPAQAQGARAKGEEGHMGTNAPAAEAPATATATAVPMPSPVTAAPTTNAVSDGDDRAAAGLGLSGIGAGGGGKDMSGLSSAPGPTAFAAKRAAAPPPAARALQKSAPDPNDPLAGLGGGTLKNADKKAAPAKVPAAQPQAAPVYAIPYVAPVTRNLSRCSDVASRPLAERVVLWQKRAKKTNNAQELAMLYDQAFASCELPDWRDEAALLDIVQSRVATEQMADIVLAHFKAYGEAQRFLAKNLLRRTVDPRIAAAVSRALYNGIDWLKVDRDLADLDKPEKQLAYLRKAQLVAPGDPQGDVRMVRVLARGGPEQRQEALALGRRLRDRGFLTPTLATQLGDVLVDAKENDEAMRTYSEIVEFDGESRDARKLLGDIYLRQGWYAASYRQYKTLTDLDAKNPLAWLRLANAAAGAGRIDEALRIERDVSSGEGTPGPNDPRMFARLLSASRLGQLFAKPDEASGATPDAVARKLKELSLFSGPGTLSILVWEDLDAQLFVGNADEKKEPLAGEQTDASAVGLYAILGSQEQWDRAPHAARYKSEILQRRVPFKLVVIAWDGRKFDVKVTPGKMEPGAKSQSI